MKFILSFLVLIGFCFDINSGNSKGCCKSCRGGDDSGPGSGIKFDADINVGPDDVTIKPVGGSEIKLNDGNNVDLNINKLVNDSYLKSTVAYKFNYSKLIKNAKITVDEETKKNPYLIAIVSLEGDESSKYIVIVSKEDGDMRSLFYDLNITGVSLLASNGITNMEDIFNGCKGLTVCNVNIDTSKVTNMSGIFYKCSALTSLPDISGWDTSNVTNMSFMFYGCKLLKLLPDISKWDTSKVKDMNYMFSECSKLESLPDISEWNTNNVTNMKCMFYGCKSLKSLPDISKWNTNNVEDMSGVFSWCKSLDELQIPVKFK